MKVEFLPRAEEEFSEAALYYESKEQGLGLRFHDEILQVVNHIAADPYLWRERANGERRVNCPVFPYFVSYFIRKKMVIIAAVAHAHRKPDYWQQLPH